MTLGVIIIATIAFGMGVDCPDVRQVIHWGTPEDAEMYVQGQVGMASFVVLYYAGILINATLPSK